MSLYCLKSFRWLPLLLQRSPNFLAWPARLSMIPPVPSSRTPHPQHSAWLPHCLQPNCPRTLHVLFLLLEIISHASLQNWILTILSGKVTFSLIQVLIIWGCHLVTIHGAEHKFLHFPVLCYTSIRSFKISKMVSPENP